MNKSCPKRMCIVCHEMFDKKDLLRIVKNKEGEIRVDQSGKMAGRGAYICFSSACHDKLKKAKLLNKAFKCAIPDEVYEEIELKCKKN